MGKVEDIFAVYTCKYVKKEEAFGFIMVNRLFKSALKTRSRVMARYI